MNDHSAQQHAVSTHAKVREVPMRPRCAGACRRNRRYRPAEIGTIATRDEPMKRPAGF